MKKIAIFLSLLFFSFSIFSQRDSLNVGDHYAEDQLYFSINYAQLNKLPSEISRSRFSYGLSAGFIKDIILNKKGSFSFALGIGYGFEYYNQNLKVEEVNGITSFSSFNTDESGVYKSQNIEFPIELRWRTSTANQYKFWRVYPGIKFLYNTSNVFTTTSNTSINTFKNVSSYNRFQYGLTLSVGYDLFNFNMFYNLSTLFENSNFNGEPLNTSTLKFGLIFYIL